MQCHDLRLHGLLISACPHPPLAVSLPQLKSPGSCSSHVASSARPESAHPPILLPWHFQENPSRLGAWLVNPRERGRKGRGGGRECYADLAGIVLSAGSIRAQKLTATDNLPKAFLNSNMPYQFAASLSDVIFPRTLLFSF